MSKRFGRNKKRKLQKRINTLESEVSWIKWKYDNYTKEIPHLEVDDIIISINTRDDISKTIRLEVSPHVVVIEKILNSKDIEHINNYHEILVEELSIKVKEFLSKSISLMLTQIKE